VCGERGRFLGRAHGRRGKRPTPRRGDGVEPWIPCGAPGPVEWTGGRVGIAVTPWCAFFLSSWGVNPIVPPGVGRSRPVTGW